MDGGVGSSHLFHNHSQHDCDRQTYNPLVVSFKIIPDGVRCARRPMSLIVIQQKETAAGRIRKGFPLLPAAQSSDHRSKSFSVASLWPGGLPLSFSAEISNLAKIGFVADARDGTLPSALRAGFLLNFWHSAGVESGSWNSNNFATIATGTGGIDRYGVNLPCSLTSRAACLCLPCRTSCNARRASNICMVGIGGIALPAALM